MKKAVFAAFGVLLFCGCSKEKYFDGPEFYTDGFENYNVLDSLLLPDDVYWSYTQLTIPGNTITVDTARKHSGSKALKFDGAGTTGETLSKCSISKQHMAFWEGETVRLSAWYYIEGTAPLEWLFLMDLEEQAAIGAGPGMRLALVNNKLRVEFKFNQPDILQNTGTELELPRNQWVQLQWEVKLSQKKKGTVKLWQDGQLIIDSKDKVTLPKDFLYSQQGTKGMYSSCEIGITANPSADAVMLWVDDVRMERVD